MEAAHYQDLVAANPADELSDKRSDFLLPLVKGYSSEKAYELLATSLQVFGGSGFTQDYPIEQYIRDAKIDTLYEGTTAIQAMDLFFRKIARDQGQTVAAFAAEIGEFVKATGDGDMIGPEREVLGRMLDDVQAHLGIMVGHLMASMSGTPQGRPPRQRVSLQCSAKPRSPPPKSEDAGKLPLSPTWHRVAMRRARVEAEDGSLMDLPETAF
jgi:hypothetical protein